MRFTLPVSLPSLLPVLCSAVVCGGLVPAYSVGYASTGSPYTLSLTCSDCTSSLSSSNNFDATLVLGGYTPGDGSLSDSNFVSFSYASDVVNEGLITDADLSGFINSDPGDYSITIIDADYTYSFSGIGPDSSFTVVASGWNQIINNPNPPGPPLLPSDIGTVNSFTGPGISATPEPGTVTLVGSGLALAAALRRKLRLGV